MKYISAIVKGLVFATIGFGVGYLLYYGICDFLSVWEEGPKEIIYSPIYIPTIVGFLGGLSSGLNKQGGCASILGILIVAIALIVLLVVSLIIGGIIDQEAYWIILLLIGLLGGGHIIVRIFFD